MQDFRYTTYFYNDIIKESLLNFEFHKLFIMEGRSNNKRANEPKHLRRKVVFVDPDDPDAPHWWPALVIFF